jgi:23S rRNA U2552 (ribose-2'-O)-methylase RlmE/FtsJ
MLVFEHGADLGIIGSLLDIKFGMYEIQVCYEAAVALDIQDIETIKKLIRFRRRFTDTQQSEDLAELIREALSGYIQSSSSKSPQDSTWKVPGFIDLVLDFASGIGGNNFAQVCQLLSGDKE